MRRPRRRGRRACRARARANGSAAGRHIARSRARSRSRRSLRPNPIIWGHTGRQPRVRAISRLWGGGVRSRRRPTALSRISCDVRPDFAARAAEIGFDFADPDGEPYRNERAAYLFGLREIKPERAGTSRSSPAKPFPRARGVVMARRGMSARRSIRCRSSRDDALSSGLGRWERRRLDSMCAEIVR